MISNKELLQVIAECENGKPSLANCEKLATFYTIYDHNNPKHETVQKTESFVQLNSNSEAAQMINGMEADKAWQTVIELIEAVQVLNPKLYRKFIEKLAE